MRGYWMEWWYINYRGKRWVSDALWFAAGLLPRRLRYYVIMRAWVEACGTNREPDSVTPHELADTCAETRRAV